LLHKDFKKWSINNEFLMTSFKFKSHYEQYSSINYYTITDCNVKYTNLKINTMFRYTTPLKKLFAFIQLGVSNSLALLAINDKDIKDVFYSVTKLTKEAAIPASKAYEFGVLGSLGLRYKKWFTDIRYVWGNGISDNVNLVTSTNNFYLLFGYRF
jgi:hypothetical protein